MNGQSTREGNPRDPEHGNLAPTGAFLPYDAVIFDMDGVVTDTASVHAAAWKEMFDDVLTDKRTGLTPPPELFDADADYRLYVDGRSREDGVAAVLAARGVEMPQGDADDPPDAWSIRGLAARKNRIYLALLAQQGVRVFAGTKPSMVLAGRDSAVQPSVEETAAATVRCLRAAIPPAVPGIVFLSGGQSPELATARLNAMNQAGPQAWVLSFSYSRAIQDPVLETWRGQAANVPAAQDAFARRARLNGLARMGQ